MQKSVGQTLKILGGIVCVGALLPIFIGFGTVGIAAGSLAAGIQSIIGPIEAGSLFATLTSLGMTGTLAGTSVAGGVVGTAGHVIEVTSPKEQNANKSKKNAHHPNKNTTPHKENAKPHKENAN